LGALYMTLLVIKFSNTIMTVEKMLKDAVGVSMQDSVLDSVVDSVADSVWRSVADSVLGSVKVSVRDSIHAQMLEYRYDC